MVYGGVGAACVGRRGLPLQTLQLLPNDYLHICKITVLGVILPLNLQQKYYEGLV